MFELGLFRREIILEFAYLLSGVLVGIITGLLIGALRWKSQLSTVKAEVEAERDAAKLINANASEMSDRFKSLAAESLKSNSESFLTLAKENLGAFQQLAKTDLDKKKNSFEQLVKPVQESLKEVGQTLQTIEKARIGDQSSLKSQVENLST